MLRCAEIKSEKSVMVLKLKSLAEQVSVLTIDTRAFAPPYPAFLATIAGQATVFNPSAEGSVMAGVEAVPSA